MYELPHQVEIIIGTDPHDHDNDPYLPVNHPLCYYRNGSAVYATKTHRQSDMRRQHSPPFAAPTRIEGVSLHFNFTHQLANCHQQTADTVNQASNTIKHLGT